MLPNTTKNMVVVCVWSIAQYLCSLLCHICIKHVVESLIARSAAQLITATSSHRSVHATVPLTVKSHVLFSNFRCVLMETETLYRIILIAQVTAAVANVTVTKCLKVTIMIQKVS
jgi:hypothetical protein